MMHDVIGRVRRLLLSPKTEWAAIAAEPSDMTTIYRSYAGPLIVASAAAQFVGTVLFGAPLGMEAQAVHPGIGTALEAALFNILIGFAGVYIFALIVDALAPRFGAEKNFERAFKVSAYFPTAYWIAALALVIPALSFLVMVASLYSLYLLFVGLPLVMKPAAGKGFFYTLVALIAYVAVGLVFLMVLGALHTL